MDRTPVHFLESINGNEVYLKREDLIPYSFGGNKARKAFAYFSEIDQTETDCVVTYGSSSSNHCRVVSNMCCARGIKCIIICPEEVSGTTNNSLLMTQFGAEMIIVPVSQVHDTIENTMEALRQSGSKPYFIPGGGHGRPGIRAYVDCYREITDYERESNLHFDYIFFASGTGGTQAGLVAGQLMTGDVRQIVGISIARKNPYGRNVVIDGIHEYAGDSFSDELISENTVFDDSYVGQGYGKQNEGIMNTIRRMMNNHGVPLDPTYTGKAFYGMEQYLTLNGITGKKILFIHTGGTPLFFDGLRNEH